MALYFIVMVHFATGHCDAGYYAGWDKKGLETRESCDAVCLSETQCTYAAWQLGHTCSRFKNKECNLNPSAAGFDKHETFKKQISPGTFCFSLEIFLSVKITHDFHRI